MKALILLSVLMPAASVPCSEALNVVSPVEKLTDEQNKLLVSVLRSEWESRVAQQAVRKSSKTKERVQIKKALESLRDGGEIGYSFEGTNSEKLTLKRLLTVKGMSLNSGSYRAKPISLVDGQNIIVELFHDDAEEGETIWVTGIDVSSVLSEDTNVEIDAVFLQMKPKSYTNPFGATRTVKHWQAIEPGYVAKLWETHKADHAAELSKDFDRICKDARAGRIKSPYAVE